MSLSTHTDLQAEVGLLRRQLQRERQARATAEKQGERATAGLHETVRQLSEAQAQLRRRAEEQKLVNEVSRELRSDLEPDLVLRRAVAAIGRAVGADRCVIRLAAGEGIGAAVQQWSRPGLAGLPSDAGLTESFGALCRAAAHEGRSLVIDDVDADPRVDADVRAWLRDRLGVSSYAGTPMSAGNQLVGWIALHGLGDPTDWTSEQLELTEMLGHDVAVALMQSQAHRDQQEAIARLEELDRVKSDLVSTISHELRTPLTSIGGYLEILTAADHENLTPHQRQMLEVVDRNTLRLRRLVEDLLLLSQVEHPSSVGPPASRLDLATVVESVRESLTPMLAGRRLELGWQVRPGLPTVLGDPDHVARVLENLLSNAVKFTADGGRVCTLVEGERDAVVITVSDTGRGIDEADLPHVFERFFRSARATAQAIQGTGLGLSVAAALVTELRGTIDIDSALDQGTTVTVRLPCF